MGLEELISSVYQSSEYLIIIFYIAAGAIVGVLSGIFGIGGGMIVVPTLMICLPVLKVDESVSSHLAIGSSHATIIFTAMASAYSYHKKGNVDLQKLKYLAPGLIIGAFIIGSNIARYLSSDFLRMFFAIFMFLMSAKIIFWGDVISKNTIDRKSELAGVGTIIGTISAMLGVGGGSMSVPYLTWKGVDIRKAVGTSAACASLIALFSCGGFVISGWGNESLPKYSLGFVYLPAVLGIIASSVLCVRIGSAFAHRISPRTQKRAFAVFLIMVGLKMIFI